jgi:hypothetical protein
MQSIRGHDFGNGTGSRRRSNAVEIVKSSDAYAYTFEFARGEHIRATRAIYKHRMHDRWRRRFLLLSVLLFAAFVVANTAADLRRGRFPGMFAAWVVFAAWPFLPLLNGYLAARKWEQLNPAKHRTVSFRVGDDGIRSTSFPGSVDLRWAGIKQVIETSEFLLFFMTHQAAAYLPKRAVPDVDIGQLRQMIRLHGTREHFRVALR